jgi:cell division protein FtsB
LIDHYSFSDVNLESDETNVSMQNFLKLEKQNKSLKEQIRNLQKQVKTLKSQTRGLPESQSFFSPMN